MEQNNVNVANSRDRDRAAMPLLCLTRSVYVQQEVQELGRQLVIIMREQVQALMTKH